MCGNCLDSEAEYYLDGVKQTNPVTVYVEYNWSELYYNESLTEGEHTLSIKKSGYQTMTIPFTYYEPESQGVKKAY